MNFKAIESIQFASFLLRSDQGCQIVCFQTQNPDLGKFWRALDWKMFKYFVAIWDIL
jgi:hypothetical protein